MNIYHYSPITKEFLNSTIAESNPEETKKQGKFVPLIPANSTLTAPPKVNKNQIAAFKNGSWEITPDYRGYYTVNDDLSLNEIKEIGQIEGIIVDKELAETIKTNPELYKIEDNSVILKTESEIEEENEQKEKARIANLKLTKREVFLGLYRAKGITPEALKAQITTPEALIEFEYANDYYRGNPLISSIGAVLGISENQLDEFFETGDYTKLLPEDNKETEGE